MKKACERVNLEMLTVPRTLNKQNLRYSVAYAIEVGWTNRLVVLIDCVVNLHVFKERNRSCVVG
jgi:hypothetical protein